MLQQCYTSDDLGRSILKANLYVGHPISSDNGLISQKLKSKFYYPLHVAMGVAYSCLRYGVFTYGIEI